MARSDRLLLPLLAAACCLIAVSTAKADFSTPFVETAEVGETSTEFGYVVSLGRQRTDFLVVVMTDDMEFAALRATAEDGVVPDSLLGRPALVTAKVVSKTKLNGKTQVELEILRAGRRMEGVAAALADAKGDPRQLVKLRFHGVTPYNSLAEAFDETSLPRFYDILKDKTCSGLETGQAVIFIGQISDRGNQEASNALLDFVRRDVAWDKWGADPNEARNFVSAKWNALDWYGYIGGRDAEQVLRTALTSEGAKALAKNWLGGVPEAAFSQAAVVETLRGHAALGLAYSDNPEVQQLVKAEYQRERQACIDAAAIGDHYFNQLSDAMTRMDVVAKIGLEAHRDLWDGEGTYSNLYGKHIHKYLLFKAVEGIELKF